MKNNVEMAAAGSEKLYNGFPPDRDPAGTIGAVTEILYTTVRRRLLELQRDLLITQIMLRWHRRAGQKNHMTISGTLSETRPGRARDDEITTGGMTKGA
jgi:hypothetical protein